MNISNPIVIDPPGFDPQAAWAEATKQSESYEAAGRPLAAAAFADPGICFCPNCQKDYWAWGRWVRCIDCGFEFPTHAWAMFSWGVQAGWRKKVSEYESRTYAKNPYWAYGFSHANEIDKKAGLFRLFADVDWLTVFGANHFAHRESPSSDDLSRHKRSIPRKSKRTPPSTTSSPPPDHT